jgi:hypothetical protein
LPSPPYPNPPDYLAADAAKHRFREEHAAWAAEHGPEYERVMAELEAAHPAPLPQPEQPLRSPELDIETLREQLAERGYIAEIWDIADLPNAVLRPDLSREQYMQALKEAEAERDPGANLTLRDVWERAEELYPASPVVAARRQYLQERFDSVEFDAEIATSMIDEPVQSAMPETMAKTIRQYAQEVADGDGIRIAAIYEPGALLERSDANTASGKSEDDFRDAVHANMAGNWIVLRPEHDPDFPDLYHVHPTEQAALADAEEAAADYLLRNDRSLDGLRSEIAAAIPEPPDYEAPDAARRRFEREDAAWLAGQGKTFQRVYAETQAEAEKGIAPDRNGPDLEP